MSKTIEEILSPKPDIRPRIYAYSIADEAHKGLLKVGQTTRDVRQRIADVTDCDIKFSNSSAVNHLAIELEVAICDL